MGLLSSRFNCCRLLAFTFSLTDLITILIIFLWSVFVFSLSFQSSLLVIFRRVLHRLKAYQACKFLYSSSFLTLFCHFLSNISSSPHKGLPGMKFFVFHDFNIFVLVLIFVILLSFFVLLLLLCSFFPQLFRPLVSTFCTLL